MDQKSFFHSISALASVPKLDGGNLAKASAAESKEEVVRIKTACRACISNCAVIATVKNGHVVKLEGNPEDPMSKGRMCAKGFYDHPEVCQTVNLIAGFKDIDAVLFTEELEQFSKRFNTIYCLDNSEAPGFRKGFVTGYIKEIPIADWDDYNIVIVGPPAMMKFCALECLKNGAKEDHIWVSYERKMSCAVGKCGHCKINETYVCLEGPVFNYTKAKALLD